MFVGFFPYCLNDRSVVANIRPNGDERTKKELKAGTGFFHVVCGPNMNSDLIGRRHPTASTIIPSTVHSEPQWRSEEDSEEHTEDSASSSADEREPLHSEAHQQQQQPSCYLSAVETPFSGNIGLTPNHPGNPSLRSLSREDQPRRSRLVCLD